MYYSLANFPKIENEKFHKFRNKYEPYAHLLSQHIAFIFPVHKILGFEKLKNHIQGELTHWKPFDIHFKNLEKTFDHWLMLTPDEGREEAIKLHNELYRGILAPYLREDLPYTPHIALGLFSTEKYDLNNPTAKLTLDEKKYEKALNKFKALNFEI